MNNLRIINAHSWHFYDAWRRHPRHSRATLKTSFRPERVAVLPWLTWQRKWMCLCVSHGFAWPPAKCLPQTGQHFSLLLGPGRGKSNSNGNSSRGKTTGKTSGKTRSENKLWIRSSQTNTFWRAWAAMQFVSFQLPNQKWTWGQRLGNEAMRSCQRLPN